MKRRTFIQHLSVGGLAAATQSITTPSVWARGRTYQWRMATSWPKAMPILQTGAELFARQVDLMSNGRLKIEVLPDNEEIKALAVFDAVAGGSIQCGHAAAYYWANKIPAAQWFTSAPFGLNAMEMNTWYNMGGGQKLWQQIYAPYDVIPMLMGNTGIQMGGWFNREIRSEADYAGLRIRMPGLGGKVIARLNAQVVLLPGSDIIEAMEKGQIDATEWVGPYHDTLMGLHRIARYYYAPGWQEPGSATEMIFNRQAFENLPQGLKAIVTAAAAKVNQDILSEFEHHNKLALFKISREHKVQLRLFPHRVLRILERLTRDVLEEEANKDPMARKVHQAYKRFKQEMRQFSLLRGAEIMR